MSDAVIAHQKKKIAELNAENEALREQLNIEKYADYDMANHILRVEHQKCFEVIPQLREENETLKELNTVLKGISKYEGTDGVFSLFEEWRLRGDKAEKTIKDLREYLQAELKKKSDPLGSMSHNRRLFLQEQLNKLKELCGEL